MAGRIPQEFIDSLVERADIAEIVGRRVPLKKAGNEYKACCPFHNEKTPSFTVSPQKGFYHCFGCGAHGTALGFLMEHDRLDFVEAVEELAQLLGVEVPRDERTETQTPVAPIYDTLETAAQHYRAALKEHAVAIDYLKGRGLTGEIANTYMLGYAPPGWDFLLRQFPDTDTARDALLSAGLIAARDNGGHYDRLRERIVFPIRDGRGRVVGFGGRLIGDGEPKYLNSPETAVFHKGQELYGLFEARRANRSLNQIIIVEGYMDVVALARHGLSNAVATMGTATTPEHIRRLFRVCPSIVFCFDGDRAGRDAAWRALNTSLPELREGHQLQFLFLPDGEDPDSLVLAEGAEGFRQRLANATPLSDYLIDSLKTQADTQSMDGRARLAELARPLVEKIPPGVYRELLIDRLSDEIGLDRERLSGLIASPAEARRPPRRENRPRRSGASGSRSLVRRAIQLLLNYPGIGREVPERDALQRLPQRGIGLLSEILEIIEARPDINSAGVIERFRDRSEGAHLQALLAEEEPLTEAAAARELADCLARLAAETGRARLAELDTKAADSGLTAEEKEEMRALRRIRR